MEGGIILTRNKEDYLKIIYELGGHHKKVSNRDIAKALGVSAPSVSEMIRKLVKDGYVESNTYQGVILTQLGLEKATRIRRRHLLWEVFLVEKLDYDWEDVHEDAEKLEHITNPKLEKALDQYLDYPDFCPHGSPILSKGNHEIPEYISIYDLEQGQKSIIKRFQDIKELLTYTKEIGLEIGDSIEVIDKDIEGKNFLIKTKGREVKLNLKFIKNIYVE